MLCVASFLEELILPGSFRPVSFVVSRGTDDQISPLDKNKIIEAAAKYVAKGAFDKAIKEYQKILDADPRDVRILQKVGELHQKKGDTGQAAQYFTKVAESYTSDGFFLKASYLFRM